MSRSAIVAVASSVRDLEAVSELLAALPADCGLSCVIVHHLEPGREGAVAEVLAKRTELRVLYAHDGVVPEPGHVYVMRPHTTLTMSGECIRVSADGSGLLRPGDILFTSLAQERGAEAVGVVLSGGGSDSAIGIRAIKKGGGATFAQYPGSARFPSMPISAIETGCVGAVLRPNEIAHELTRLSQYAAPPRGLARNVLRLAVSA